MHRSSAVEQLMELFKGAAYFRAATKWCRQFNKRASICQWRHLEQLRIADICCFAGNVFLQYHIEHVTRLRFVAAEKVCMIAVEPLDALAARQHTLSKSHVQKEIERINVGML
jgi:hypothetical protein